MLATMKTDFFILYFDFRNFSEIQPENNSLEGISKSSSKDTINRDTG